MEKQFEDRKRDHIRLALKESNQASGQAGFDQVRLEHDALPEIDFGDVELQISSLGSIRPTPFFFAGMTAGHSDAVEINFRLAAVAAERGWALGLGSQRRDLNSVSELGIEGAVLKDRFPQLELFSNLGISQVIETPIEMMRNLIQRSGASALCIHLNALQEVLQPEGTPRFKGGLQKIQTCAEDLGVPIILKETGCGFSKQALRKLATLPVAAVDVSGLGGTHWGRIEGRRAGEMPVLSETAETFSNWGIPTVESTRLARQILNSQTEVWSTGGVRTGLDAAKLMAMGALRVGFAKPALEAALKSIDVLRIWAETREFELRTALFCTGSEKPEELGEKWTQN